MDKKSKENRKVSYILIIISIILIVSVGIGGWLLGTKFATREDEIPKIDKPVEETKKLEKEDESKDYVYEASYSYENKYQTYKEFPNVKDEIKKINYGIEVEYREGTQYLEDLRVPYINIKTEVAQKVNEQIKNLYLEYALSFDTNAKIVNDKEDLPVARHILTYQTYIHQDILSVIIIYDKEATSNWNLQYMTYNFDLKTGNVLSYEGLLSRLGYEKETAQTELEELIGEKIKSLWTEYQIKLPVSEQERFILEAKESLQESIASKKVLMFVKDGNLNVLERISYGTEDNSYYIFELTK